MIYLKGTDQVAIYIGLDQALFVLSSSRACPRCGRPASIFRHRHGHTECLGCNDPNPKEQNGIVDTVLPVYGET